MPPAILNHLLRLAAFQNPEFYNAQAMRLSTFGKPRIISCGQDFPQHVALPRGCLAEATALFADHSIKVDLRISAFTFEPVMKQVKARYMVGLTATPTRKDGHHPINYMQCGPIGFNMSARMMTVTTPFEHKVIPRHTDFQMPTEMTRLDDSGCLRRVGEGFGTKWLDRRRSKSKECLASGPVSAVALRTKRAPLTFSRLQWKDSPSTFLYSRAAWAKNSGE